jgi:hypothetical protein
MPNRVSRKSHLGVLSPRNPTEICFVHTLISNLQDYTIPAHFNAGAINAFQV